MRYRAELDGLRAICILFTICNHLPGTPAFINGTVGVDLFFALSGWLITTLILEERARPGGFGLAAFYVRRAFRILPLYFATLALYALAAWVVAKGPDAGKAAEFWRSFWYMATLCSEYRPVADSVFAHGWTLGIEEKFYLAWPALLALTGFRFGRALLGCAVIYGGLTWLMFELEGLYRGAGGLRGYGGLGFGSVLAILARREAVAAVLARLGGLGLLAFAGCYAGSILLPHWGWNVAISATGAIMVASMWHDDRQPLARVLAAGPLAATGKLTYALYLLHVLCKQAVFLVLGRLGALDNYLLTYLAVYGASLAVAYGFHRTLELPLIGMGRRFALKARPATA